ncbi:MAG: hypothetical protein JRF33_20025 [Deltaproteobacteria bacterium]|nr:hypothetical protein [Deltaproteobacteria bacterium]
MNGFCRLGILSVLALALMACKAGWVQENTPTDQDLHAIFGVPDGDVYAVGAGGTVLRRKGGQWQALESDTEADLYGVWGTSDEHVVIVGENCTALEFNGEPAEPPDGGEMPPDLRALAVSGCTPDGDKIRIIRNIDGIEGGHVAAVGDPRYEDDVPSNNFFLYEGDQIRSTGNLGDRLLGVSTPIAGEIVVSGTNGFLRHHRDGSWMEARNLRLCPVALVDEACPLAEEDQIQPILWDVWVGENGQGAVVGTFGGVWEYPPPEEGAWLPVDTGIDGDLRGVHGHVLEREEGGSEVFAVGGYGAIFRVQDGKAKRQVSGSNEDFHGVWVSPSGSDVYVVGAKGTIVHLIR